MTVRLGLLSLLLLATALAGLNLGSYPISPQELIQTVTGQGDSRQELVLFHIRLPRMAMAVLVGVGLALSGAALQGLTRNVLADPGIMGLTAGAGLAVVALLYLQQAGVTTAPLLRPAVAFCGALLAAAATFAAARKNGAITPGRLLLSGIAVNAGLSAAMLVISMRLDRQIYDLAVIWLSGSLLGKDWQQVLVMAICLALLVPVLLSRIRILNLLGLGDEAATGLGAAVSRERTVLLLIAVALAAVGVSMTGAIGFVGLLAPHIARRIVGPEHQVLLPAAAITGALLVVAADMIARNLLSPVELPTGIVVAVIGAPYFLYLLARAGKQDSV